MKVVFDGMKLDLLSAQMGFGMMEMDIQHAHAHGKNKIVVIHDNDQRALGSEKAIVMHGNDQMVRDRVEVSLCRDVTMCPHIPYQG